MTQRGAIVRRRARSGAANRIRLAEDLLVVRSRLDRQAATHGLVVIDLDRSKLINDRFGHRARDEVLRRPGCSA